MLNFQVEQVMEELTVQLNIEYELQTWLKSSFIKLFYNFSAYTLSHNLSMLKTQTKCKHGLNMDCKTFKTLILKLSVYIITA